ncbi:MAG: acyl-CoA dehydrogenase family protein [Chloroflexia bacterium]
MDFRASADVEMVVQTVRDYVEKSLLPQEMEVERAARIPPERVKEMGELGFFGLPFSEEDGGIGLGFTGYTLAMEQLGRANAVYAVMLSASSGLAGEALALGGTPEQRARFLPPLASGELLGAFALVEEGTATDGRGMRTTATPAGSGYRLDGAKAWVLNGPEAGINVVFAKLAGTDAGTGVFAIERGTPGLTTGPAREQLGLHGLGICELRLEACEVPEANRLAGRLPIGEDPGLALAHAALSRFGVTLGAIGVGLGSRMIEAARDFALQRRQFGKPIAGFGAVQNMLADSAAEIFAAQQAVYRASWGIEQGRAEPGPPAMAKLVSTETLFRVADRSMQVHGGMGFMKELWVERGYRDARMFRLLGFTSEELRTQIAGGLGCPA